MKQERNKIDMAHIYDVAEQYATLTASMKDLEARIRPLQKELIEYAEQVHLSGMHDLSHVTIESRLRDTVHFNKARITPDWLYRYQQGGYGEHLHFAFKVDVDDIDDRENELLDEIELTVDSKKYFAIKCKV